MLDIINFFMLSLLTVTLTGFWLLLFVGVITYNVAQFFTDERTIRRAGNILISLSVPLVCISVLSFVIYRIIALI